MKFNSVEQALKFAANISERSEYTKSDPLKIRGTSSTELTPMDLHAQAAMIQNAVNRLHQVERDSVMAQFGRGKERSDAIRSLAAYLMPHVSGAVPNKEVLMIVLCHWVTKRPAIRAIADDQNVSYRKVCSWRSIILRAWMPTQVRAISRLHEQMFVEGGFELQE